MIGRHLGGVEKYQHNWNGLIVRRKYKDHAELRRRVDELITQGLPAERIGGEQQTNRIIFQNGGKITMPAISQLQMVNDFVGHQYTEISLDECTTFPFFIQMVEKLKGSLRSPHGVPCHMFGTGNPGGPGHNEVKAYFKLGKDGVPPETVMYDDAGESRIFIPSFLRDNRILIENDPKYANRLLSISDPALKKAWIDGDWDVYIGQAFSLHQEYHVIEPIKIPNYSQKYMTFDWGFGKPFSIGWWFVLSNDVIVRFAEWYGWNGTPDQGLRLTDSEIAEGIREKERDMGFRPNQFIRLCDPTCFSKKPDYKGGGQGPSTSEEFAKYGIHMTPGDPSRELKIRQFRERLRLDFDETGKPKSKPKILIFKECKQFIRTIQDLCMDEDKPEDIDTDQEDHCLYGDTLVETSDGQIPISSLAGKKGHVLTVGGYWTAFSNCKMTRRNSPIVEVVFDDDRSIKCTPDHKFLTKEGCWKEAKNLYDEACYVSIPLQNKLHLWRKTCESRLSTKQHRSSMGSDIGCADVTFKEKVFVYIGQFGLFIKAPYQTVTQYITRMLIDLKIRLKTLSLNHQKNTFQTIPRIMTMLYGKKLCAEGPRSGMDQMQVLNGTRNNTSNTVKEKLIGLKIKSVSFVATVMLAGRFQSIALEDARSKHGNRSKRNQGVVSSVGAPLSDLESTVQGAVFPKQYGESVRVKSVKQAGRADVYCLDAAVTHAFAVNGGIVVHNCYDEAAHIMMARPIAIAEPKPPESPYDIRLQMLEKGEPGPEDGIEDIDPDLDDYYYDQSGGYGELIQTVPGEGNDW